LILDEFAAVTGFHRKHATRLLRAGLRKAQCGPRPGRRVYDAAVREVHSDNQDGCQRQSG
jgi:hypothetical protein